ncbi:MAG: tetraacyldisaccharide 4'-kinase [bacterium]|nr:tetraacyldisaccharide 4'-kinase [bacterium]
MNIKTKITEIHYNKSANGLLYNVLKFASVFYNFGSSLKNVMYDNGILKPKKVNAYVISVGNFTTGGVGKTPVVAEIAKYYINKGEKVAIISRGYSGKLDNKKVNVISDGINLHYKADMAGDEPYWLAINLNMCAVLTCADRYKASKYAVEEMGITHIILDDGFQHRKMYRDENIVLVDSQKIFGNNNLLPAGPLRENLNGFNRVNKIIVVSKSIEHSLAEKLAEELKNKYEKETFVCKTEPDYIYNIISGEHLAKNEEITAISAIGQPEQFYKFLENDYKIARKVSFDDHHQYNISDIDGINGKIVTTEKDAVKLALLNRNDIYALKLKTTIDIENLLKN